MWCGDVWTRLSKKMHCFKFATQPVRHFKHNFSCWCFSMAAVRHPPWQPPRRCRCSPSCCSARAGTRRSCRGTCRTAGGTASRCWRAGGWTARSNCSLHTERGPHSQDLKTSRPLLSLYSCWPCCTTKQQGHKAAKMQVSKCQSVKYTKSSEKEVCKCNAMQIITSNRNNK